MRFNRATRYVIMISLALIVSTLLTGNVQRAHAVTSYALTALPFLSQEGSTITIVFSVSGATPSTFYQFRFIVKDPASKLHNSNIQGYNTTASQTSFTLPIFQYPTVNFPGPNDLVGQYFLNATQVRPIIPNPDVAQTSFIIFITDNYQYERTQTVNLHAIGYNASEPVTIKISTQTFPTTTVFQQTTTASLAGHVDTNWKIPRNATIDPNGYLATITGTTTVKAPADVNGFNVKLATMSVSALNSIKNTYQRTETMSFSFQSVYPDGTPASTGTALLTLTRPGGGSVTLTTSYSSSSQTFNATYKTTFNNATGTWKASLGPNGYSDAWGNSGPAATMTNSPQLIPATLTIGIAATGYIPIGQQVKFNATISYPDGSMLTTGTGVKSFLIYTGTPAVTEIVPVTFDSTLQFWRGSYTPKTSDPGGLWSLVVNATDSPTPPNTGYASTPITLQDRPPVASFTVTPPSAPTLTAISFNGTASYDPDGTVVSYSWNFGDGTTGSGAIISHSFNTAQTYTVTLTVTDNGGVTGQTSSPVTITDRPPRVTFTISPSTANTGQTLTLTITSSDLDGTISTTKVDWGDGTIDLLSGAVTADTHSYASTGSSTSKIFSVVITVTDNSGSTGSSSQGVTILDRPPTVSFTPSSTSILTGQNVTITITASDVDGTISSKLVNWGDGTIDTLSATATTDIHNYASTGSSPTKTITITVNATDNSGSIGSYTSQITVSDRPPTSSINISTTTATTGQTVTVSITSSDPDGTISSTKVDWGDGVVDALTGGPTQDTHTYTSTGLTSSKTYAVIVTVTDNSGSTASSNTSTISISDRAPVVTISASPTTASTGQTVTVSITSSDPDGTIASTVVSWGDGTADTLNGAQTRDTHSYASTGSSGSKNYTIAVSVTDNSGSTTSSLPATVTVQSSSSSSLGNLSLPLYYFAILAVAIAALLVGGFLAFRRHRVTHARLKIDLEAVRSEAGRIENQDFFQSVKDQLHKDKEEGQQ